MNQLQVIEFEGQLVTDSREVAEMVGKQHKDLLESIRGYIKHLISGNFRSTDFFIEHTYTDNLNRSKPCYLLTRKGCDMVANKMTGEKGVQFTATYVTRFEEMEKQLTQPKLPTNYKEAVQHLLLQLEENEKLQTTNLVLEQRVNELQPKASYYDMVLQNKSLLSVSKIAKDYGLSAIKLNQLLNKLGVQYKQGDIWLIYAKYQDKGYTQTTTHVIDAEHSRISTKWTQKGRLFIYDLLKQQGILPLIEREVVI